MKNEKKERKERTKRKNTNITTHNIWNLPSKEGLGPIAVIGLCVGWDGRLTVVKDLEFVMKYFLRSLIVEEE